MAIDLDAGGRTAQCDLGKAVEQARRVRIDGGAAGIELDGALAQNFREQALAHRGIDRGGCGFHRDLGFRGPAFRQFLRQPGADLVGRAVVKRVAGQFHFAVGHHQRSGGEPRQRAQRAHHRIGEALGRADAGLEIVHHLLVEELALRGGDQRGMDGIVRHIAGQGQRHADRVLVGLEHVRRRGHLVAGDGEALGQVTQRRRDRLAPAQIARHAGQAHGLVGQGDLAFLEAGHLLDQHLNGGIEALRRAARKAHMVGHLDAVERRLGSLQQARLDGGQRRTATKRHAHHVALGRPDVGLGFRHEFGLIFHQPHARDRFDRRHRTATALFGKCIGGKRHVPPGNGNAGLVEHVALDCRGDVGGEILLDRNGAVPGRQGPQNGERDEARPPLPAPPENSVHPISRRVWKHRQNKCLVRCQFGNAGTGAEARMVAG